ncbi:MAG: hypothetical protein AAB209_05925 [Bacteroidota bacterium]|jgi:hypothetical protein
MNSSPLLNKIESQLSLLNEEQQSKVSDFIAELLQEHREKTADDMNLLLQVVGIGESDVDDLADEHDHYIYGTPKKKSAQ